SDASSTTTRWFCVSATYTRPPSTSTAFGFENDVPLGFDTAQTTLGPDGSQSSTLLLFESATTRRDPKAALSNGHLSCPTAAPTFPNFLPVGVPSVKNSDTRLFFVSATHTLVEAPFVPSATPLGQLKPGLPSPQPRSPHAVWYVNDPSFANRST